MTLCRGNTSICNIKGHFDYTFYGLFKMMRKKNDKQDNVRTRSECTVASMYSYV